MSAFDDVAETYAAIASGVNGHAVYVHIVRNPNPLFGAAFAAIRDQYKGAIMLSGGYDATSGAAAIENGTADLISFGRPFIGNPDLPHRLQTGAALADHDPNTHYAATAVGYTDYPALEG